MTLTDRELAIVTDEVYDSINDAHTLLLQSWTTLNFTQSISIDLLHQPSRR
jgi:hypothetical protein